MVKIFYNGKLRYTTKQTLILINQSFYAINN